MSKWVPFAAGGMALTMLGVSFAAKPLYDTFCRITGFGGTTQVAEAGSDRILERTITVRFDATTARGLAVDFKPLQRTQTVRLGENGLAFYRFTNTSNTALRAVASYNVTPHKAGPYFQKMECFCFVDQTFGPGETMDLPVVYYVDPALADDGLDDVREVTLSYTFFESKKPGADPALQQASAPAIAQQAG